jgi:hypothetical protein
MSYGDYPDPAERYELTEVEALVVDLFTEYMDRRAEGGLRLYLELRARASEHGDCAAEAFETAVLVWESARLGGDV